MKTAFLFLFLCSSITLFAQSAIKAKTLLTENNLIDAKKEIDAFLAIESNTKGAEAYYTKAKIYNAISLDPQLSRQLPAARWEAFVALKRYTELDDEMLISLQKDDYKPINEIYTGFYQEAANSFNSKDYKNALEGFASAVKVSRFMNQKGLINMKLDTNSVLYAGVSAEKLNLYAEAANYYSMLIDHRVKGEGFVEIYKWVTNYYFEKKDAAIAQFYLAIGKEVYPEDPFWNSLELDMVREQGNKDKLFAQYEKTIAAEPKNYLYRYNYAVELYQYAYNVDPTKRPTNSASLIAKSEAQMQEVVRLAPTYTKGQLFVGQIKYNKGVDLLNESKAAAEPQKNELKARAIKQFSEALSYFLTVEKLIGSNGTVKASDKEDLKEALDLLITIYDQRGEREKKVEYEGKLKGAGD